MHVFAAPFHNFHKQADIEMHPQSALATSRASRHQRGFAILCGSVFQVASLGNAGPGEEQGEGGREQQEDNIAISMQRCF